MRRATVLASVLAAALAGPACALDLAAELSRDIGLTPGDLIESRVRLPAGGQPIDGASLPAPGRVAAWLELRSVQHSGGELRLLWQILGTVPATEVLALPRIELRTTGGTGVTVAPARFHLSSTLPETLDDRAPRPMSAPVPFDVHGPQVGALVSSILALLSATGLLWAIDRLPWLPRHPGPMLRLRRALRRAPAGDAELDVPTLQRVHAALAEAAGQTLYPDTLHRLFEAQPTFVPQRASIETFFAASWPSIFGAQDAIAPARERLDWLDAVVLAERLSRRRGR